MKRAKLSDEFANLKIGNSGFSLIDLIEDRTGTTVWQNSNDSSAFSSKTVNIDLSQYKWFKVLYRVSKSDSVYASYDVPIKSTTIRCVNAGWSQDYSTDVVTVRNIVINNDSFTFGDCACYGIGQSTYTNVNGNAMMIPNKIIGYKYNWNK